MKGFFFIFLLFLVGVHGYAQQAPVACFTGDSIGSPPCSITFTDLSLNNPTAWSWIFTGGTPPTSTIQNIPSVTWMNQGTYDVSLTVDNAFGSDNETKVGVVTFTANTCFFDTTIGTPCTTATGLEDLAIVDQPISIHPNPSTGVFMVDGRWNMDDGIQVFDLYGREVTSHIIRHTSYIEVDMSYQPKGVYMVRVGQAVSKLVVQ